MARGVDTLRRGLILALFIGGTACSADAVQVSTPTLQTEGSFVAVESMNGGYVLLRTVLTLTLDNKKVVLFMLRYPEMPKDLEEARALARGPALTSTSVELLLEESFVEGKYEVVWFRTLTDEERDVVL